MTITGDYFWKSSTKCSWNRLFYCSRSSWEVREFLYHFAAERFRFFTTVFRVSYLEIFFQDRRLWATRSFFILFITVPMVFCLNQWVSTNFALYVLISLILRGESRAKKRSLDFRSWSPKFFVDTYPPGPVSFFLFAGNSSFWWLPTPGQSHSTNQYPPLGRSLSPAF